MMKQYKRHRDYGFFDQSHLINEYKEMIGGSPSAINLNEFP